MSFYIENNTDININYVNRILKANTLQYDFMPDLHIRVCGIEQAPNFPHPNCSINGYCFYDSKQAGNKFVFSKDGIYLALENNCLKAELYCPSEMPSYKQHEILRLISIAFLCSVIKDGGIYIRGTVILHNNKRYFVCSGDNDIIARKRAEDTQVSDSAADYCLLQNNGKYLFYALPWSKKNNNYNSRAYAFDSVIFINSKPGASSVSQLSREEAMAILTKNNYMRNISEELYKAYIKNAERISEAIKVYTMPQGF
ncbi:MAG: hypothetical protein K6F76_00485 [Clostridiales bacterium]|nr:hypothetical protein [Clostridiales bacterium]